MSTYLLRWNPSDWPQNEYDEYFQKFERGDDLRWSCGTTKKIRVGDQFYLLKSGTEDRGVIGSGTIVKSPYLDKHFTKEHADSGLDALYVGVRFDFLTKPGMLSPIIRQELDAPGLSSTVWDVQGTGKQISDEVARELDRLWRARVPMDELRTPDELDSAPSPLREGTARQVLVNAYERHPDARRRCVNKWGMNCSVCQFRFDATFGDLGKGYIHVHHLTPIATIGTEYQLDPERDLRPVCPNCHAMLHRHSPPLSIEELQKIIATHQRSI